MARKVARVTISSEGRDQGKQFVLTEMPARQAEKWAGRALLAFVGSGLDIPEDVLNQGMAAMATFGFKAFTALKFEAAEPLMDEMFRCIEICPDPSKPGVVRSLIDDDIEEMSTILRLRMEVFQLHVDFSIAAVLSGLVEKAKAAANSRTTSTSPAPSAL